MTIMGNDLLRDPAVPAALTERRRPGRRNDVHPALIPLLRGQVLPPPGPDLLWAPRRPGQFKEGDDLGPARGIGLGVLISLAFWGVVFVLA